MVPWVDSPMNAGALSPTSIPNDVTGVKNRLARMIMAKVMRVRVFNFILLLFSGYSKHTSVYLTSNRW